MVYPPVFTKVWKCCSLAKWCHQHVTTGWVEVEEAWGNCPNQIWMLNFIWLPNFCVIIRLFSVYSLGIIENREWGRDSRPNQFFLKREALCFCYGQVKLTLVGPRAAHVETESSIQKHEARFMHANICLPPLLGQLLGIVWWCDFSWLHWFWFIINVTAGLKRLGSRFVALVMHRAE